MYVGRAIPRDEDRRLLCGRGEFTDDIRLADCAHLVLHGAQPLRDFLLNAVRPVETVPGCLGATISDIGLDGGEQSWQSPRPVRFQGG